MRKSDLLHRPVRDIEIQGNRGVASLVAQMADSNRRLDERFARIDERFARIEERFARIDDRFARIEAILIEHNRILQALPEAIRDKIGFKPPGS